MAVATKQSLKAAQLKELEEEQRRFEEQAAKKKAAEEAAAKKAAAENKKADLPGYRPQETISKDEMYSMLGIQTNLGTSKQATGDTIAKAAGAQGGIDKIENAKTRKAAEQARKYKEADLVGAKNSDYQKRLEQEKTEYLNIKEARDKKYALEQELLKAKAGAKEQSMNAGTAAVVASGRKGGNSVVDLETRERMSGLEKEISDLGRDINLAERAQNKKHLYNSALKAEDFEKYSFEPEEETKPETIKPNRQNIERETETVKRFMTEDEKAVYNYYLNKFGKEKAEEFFDSIREELNQRQAKAIFEGNEGKTINEYIQ
ncbi:MAG: hypothetical protein IKK14_06920, partial [Oscillospiraceae bacterium]|nr:hypothetical protein [Oscillospiraceae bacterium]